MMRVRGPGRLAMPRAELRGRIPLPSKANGAYYPGPTRFPGFLECSGGSEAFAYGSASAPSATRCRLVTMTVAACSCQIHEGGASGPSANQGCGILDNAILTSHLDHPTLRARRSPTCCPRGVPAQACLSRRASNP
jgi:hypothetical protein